MAAIGATALAEKRYAEALVQAGAAARERLDIRVRDEVVWQAWPDALDAALSLGDLDAAAELLELASRPPGHVPPYLRLQHRRYRALLSAARGDSAGVEADLLPAADGFRDVGYRNWFGRALLAEALELFTRLGAQSWIAATSHLGLVPS